MQRLQASCRCWQATTTNLDSSRTKRQHRLSGTLRFAQSKQLLSSVAPDSYPVRFFPFSSTIIHIYSLFGEVSFHVLLLSHRILMNRSIVHGDLAIVLPGFRRLSYYFQDLSSLSPLPGLYGCFHCLLSCAAEEQINTFVKFLQIILNSANFIRKPKQSQS